MGDQVAFQAAGVVEVELLNAFAGREPGGPDPALAAVGLPGGDLALQAGDKELLMGPGLRPGPFGEPATRLAQSGAFNARVRYAISAVMSRAASWRPPSRHRPSNRHAQRGVVVSQRR